MEKEELTEEELRKWYWDDGMSLRDIQDETGVFSLHISQQMEALGIHRRSPQEARSYGSKWAEPGIMTHADSHDYIVHNDGEETHRIRMDKANALVDYSIDELQGKVLHHKNGVKWLSYPSNVEVLTPAQFGKRNASEPRKKRWEHYASRLHFYVEEVMEEEPELDEMPEIRVFKV
ncbi:hypothetical protein ACERIT_05030 [Halopenitus sp. H-Gu1]|uniref:hypothetical protein n=1 Tax=Halopenitus sp. H-Gu1 TaxID=3242697 RepID=UPI00359CEC11